MDDFEHLDHYELLGVAENASEKEIKSAYYQQVAQYHPDRYATASAAEQAYASRRMQRINEAYRVLSNPSSRSAYQRSRDNALARTSIGPRSRPTTPPSPPSSSRDYQAELYAIAVEHLADGRYMQAIATLRELQRLNPFYRDSATLLLQAEAALVGKSSHHQPTHSPIPRPSSTNIPLWPGRLGCIPFTGGLAALLLLGITGMFLFFPHVMIPAGEASEGIGTKAIALSIGTTSPIAVVFSSSPMAVASSPTPTVAMVSPSPTAVASSPTPTVVMVSPSPTAVTPAPTPTVVMVSPSPTVITPSPSAMVVTSSPITGTPVSPMPPTTNSAEGGELLRSFTTFGEWAVAQGNGWSLENSVEGYRVFANAGVGHVWSCQRAPRSTDLSIGTNVQIQGLAAGLVFYFTDAQSYLAFAIDPQQSHYTLDHFVKGTRTILAQGTTSALRRATSADEPVRHRLVVHLAGQHIRLFINAELVLSERFEDIVPSDQYGFLAIGGNTATTATFTDLEIRTLPQSP